MSKLKVSVSPEKLQSILSNTGLSLAVVHQELRVITRILEAGLEGQLQRSDVLAV